MHDDITERLAREALMCASYPVVEHEGRRFLSVTILRRPVLLPLLDSEGELELVARALPPAPSTVTGGEGAYVGRLC